MTAIRPIVFGPRGARVRGALVSPPGAGPTEDDGDASRSGVGRSGVVICDPFGIEALAADRAMNHLSAALATAGHAVLRFAPPGLGDSDDLADGASIVGPWRSAISAAIDVLRAESGCAHVTLVGLRVGATLGAEVASTRDDVDRLVLWAPLAGRPFVRELRMLGAGVGEPDPRSCATPPSRLAVEAGGFGLSDTSVADLAGVDLLALTRRPAAEVLMVDRDDIRAAGRLVTHLRGLGAHVDAPELAGYSAMRLDDPEVGDIPTATIAAMAAWISRPGAAVPPARIPPTPSTPMTIAEALALDIDGTELLETAVRIPVKDARELHAIVTRSARPNEGGLALVLLTTGSNPCCGAGRLHTRLARHWAIAGHTVVRLDRRGVGLSELSELLHADPPGRVTSRPDERRGALGEAYDETHIDDVAAIEQFVRIELGPERVVLVGTCSGAYTAYRAARSERSGTGVHALIAINQIIFDDHAWTTGEESPAYAIKARYELGQALRHPSRWMDLVRGEIPVVPAVRRLARFAALRLQTVTRTVSARLRGRPAPDFGVSGDLQAIASAGIRQTYVFDEAETGLGYLRLHVDAQTTTLVSSGLLQQHTVSGAGHTFGPEWSKQWLIETLDRTLADLR